MLFQKLADMVGSPTLRQKHRASVGQAMEQSVESSPMIEQQKVERTQRRPWFVEFLKQAAEIVHHAFRLSRRSGSKQDQPWLTALLKLTDQRMRLGLCVPREKSFSLGIDIDLKCRVDDLDQ